MGLESYQTLKNKEMEDFLQSTNDENRIGSTVTYKQEFMGEIRDFYGIVKNYKRSKDEIIVHLVDVRMEEGNTNDFKR